MYGDGSRIPGESVEDFPRPACPACRRRIRGGPPAAATDSRASAETLASGARAWTVPDTVAPFPSAAASTGAHSTGGATATETSSLMERTETYATIAL